MECNVAVNITSKIGNIMVPNFLIGHSHSSLLFGRFLYGLYIDIVNAIRFDIVSVYQIYLDGIVHVVLRFSIITYNRISHRVTNIVPTRFDTVFSPNRCHVRMIRSTHNSVGRVLDIDLPFFRK